MTAGKPEPAHEAPRDLSLEELEAQIVTELPAREAMSLLDPSLGAAPGLGSTPSLGAPPSLGGRLLEPPGGITLPVEPPQQA